MSGPGVGTCVVSIGAGIRLGKDQDLRSDEAKRAMGYGPSGLERVFDVRRRTQCGLNSDFLSYKGGSSAGPRWVGLVKASDSTIIFERD